jgi:hypothetical protein
VSGQPLDALNAAKTNTAGIQTAARGEATARLGAPASSPPRMSTSPGHLFGGSTVHPGGRALNGFAEVLLIVSPGDRHRCPAASSHAPSISATVLRFLSADRPSRRATWFHLRGDRFNLRLVEEDESFGGMRSYDRGRPHDALAAANSLARELGLLATFSAAHGARKTLAGMGGN